MLREDQSSSHIRALHTHYTHIGQAANKLAPPFNFMAHTIISSSWTLVVPSSSQCHLLGPSATRPLKLACSSELCKLCGGGSQVRATHTHIHTHTHTHTHYIISLYVHIHSHIHVHTPILYVNVAILISCSWVSKINGYHLLLRHMPCTLTDYQ